MLSQQQRTLAYNLKLCSSCQSRITARPSGASQYRSRSHVVDYAKGLGALVTSNQISKAVQLLEVWLDQDRRPHALSTGDLLEVLCKQGRHETAWHLLRRLSASNNRLPLQVLHRLLKIAGQHGTVDNVLAVYNHQQQYYSFASTAVQTTLIHALLKAHARGKPGNLLAYEAWQRLKGSGRQLDAQALLAGVHACVCVNRLSEAETLLEPLKAVAGAVGRPMVSAYNLIMKGHLKAANTNAARKLFVAMKAKGLTPDAVTYNTLLATFVSAGEVLRAKAVMDKMKREAVQPDVWSYTALTVGLGQQMSIKEIQTLLGDMVAAGIEPTEATYTALVDAYVSAGDMAAAHSLLEHLVAQQQQQQQPTKQQHQQRHKHQRQQGQQPKQQLQPQGKQLLSHPQPQQKQKQMQQQQQQRVQQLRQVDRQHRLQQQQQPQQQQLPDSATLALQLSSFTGATVLSLYSLRQMYNTLIKGHLQAALSDAAIDSPVETGSNRIGAEMAAVAAAIGQKNSGAAAGAGGDIITTPAPSGRQSGFEAALAVLQGMSSVGVPPGVDTYTLFVVYATEVGDVEALQLLLESMTATGCEPDQILLTSMLKAAGQLGDLNTALEIFDALVQTTLLPTAQQPALVSSGGSPAPAGDAATATTAEVGPATAVWLVEGDAVVQVQPHDLQERQQQQQWQQDTQQAQQVQHLQQHNKQHSKQQQSKQQKQHQKYTEQQKQLPRGHQQRLRPLTAAYGPDAVAWNALVAVLANMDRLPDAAAALERSMQAAATAGQTEPPIEGFSALIRGYRHAGSKGKAVALFRRFLSSGGKPARVMCNDVIKLCLKDDDLKTARQVVRAMELTGCLSDADAVGYNAWFADYQARKHGRGSSSMAAHIVRPSVQAEKGSSSSEAAGSPDTAAAVERLKWWLGLPNSYYKQ